MHLKPFRQPQGLFGRGRLLVRQAQEDLRHLPRRDAVDLPSQPDVPVAGMADCGGWGVTDPIQNCMGVCVMCTRIKASSCDNPGEGKGLCWRLRKTGIPWGWSSLGPRWVITKPDDRIPPSRMVYPQTECRLRI